MEPLYEIASKAIIQTIELSEEAHDLIIKCLNDNNDYITAAKALLIPSRYYQLNRDHKINLLNIILRDETTSVKLVRNYKYLCRCRKYEFDLIINEMSNDKLTQIFMCYPKDYLDSLIRKYKNDKFLSIITFIKIQKNI